MMIDSPRVDGRPSISTPFAPRDPPNGMFDVRPTCWMPAEAANRSMSCLNESDAGGALGVTVAGQRQAEREHVRCIEARADA